MKVTINNPTVSTRNKVAKMELYIYQEHENEPSMTPENIKQRAQRALQAEFAAVPQVINQEQLDHFLGARLVRGNFKLLTHVLRQSNWKLPTKEPLWIPYTVTPPKGASIDVRVRGAMCYGCKVYGAMALNEGWRFSTAASFREPPAPAPRYTISIAIPKSEVGKIKNGSLGFSFDQLQQPKLTLVPTPKAQERPLAAFRDVGWSDQQLVDYGYAKWVSA